MAWWRPRCPVRPEEQAWVDGSLDWLRREFGRARLPGTVVLPTDEFFPGTYTGSRDDVRTVFGRLCRHMGIDPASVDLRHYAVDDGHELAGHVPVTRSWHGAAGLHRARDGRSVVEVEDGQARRPTALVATIAHELGHVLLHGQRRIDADRADGEPLTDLLTVYFGLGIFTANAALDVYREAVGAHTYEGTSRLGYLTEPMYGYALARYAWLRGEPDPAWARHLDTNPRTFLRRGLRYLRAQSAMSA